MSERRPLTPWLLAWPATLLFLGLVVLPLEVPLWHFPSGAWMRQSTREYPIMRRALQILRERCGTDDTICAAYDRRRRPPRDASAACGGAAVL